MFNAHLDSVLLFRRLMVGSAHSIVKQAGERAARRPAQADAHKAHEFPGAVAADRGPVALHSPPHACLLCRVQHAGASLIVISYNQHAQIVPPAELLVWS